MGIYERMKKKPLPDVAMYISYDMDEWDTLENMLVGYRTRSVEGRESLIKNLKINEDIVKIGGVYNNYKVGTRTIEITFDVVADSQEYYYNLVNSLHKILLQEEFYIRFNDDENAYYKATLQSIDEGTHKIARHPKAHLYTDGKITLVCPDPHKYSLTTKTIEAIVNEQDILTAEFENAGNVPCDIDYKLKMLGDNGAIGISNGTESLQYGYYNENDTETHVYNEEVISFKDKDVAQNMFDAIAIGYDYNGIHYMAIENDSSDTIYSAGVFHKDLYDYEGERRGALSLWIYFPLPIGWQNGTKSGANITFPVPKTTAGKQPKNFSVETRAWFTSVSIKETGFAMITCLDTDKNPICTMMWYDNTQSSLLGNIRMKFYNQTATYYSFDTSQTNGIASPTTKPIGALVKLEKRGNTITLQFDNIIKSITIDGISDVELGYVQIGLAQYMSFEEPDLAYRNDFLYNFIVTALNVEKEEDIPNRYSKDDEIVIKGEEGTMYKNGIVNYNDEVTGSTYFKAKVGENKISFGKSSWAQNYKASVTIRERWL